MIKEIVLPDLGEGIERAEVSEVAVSVGQSVSKNDILLVLESDKSSMEIPSDHSGKVVEVFVNSGEEVSTGQKLSKQITIFLKVYFLILTNGVKIYS